MSHKACFRFRTHGGVCAGEQWIYDGDEPIARFEHIRIEQPEQNLRYFDGNKRPVNLRDLKFNPGGRPLVAGVQLFWVFQHNVLATTELVSVDAEGNETDSLVLTVVTRDPGGVATSRRNVTITWDEELGSYVYDFKCHLEIHSPEVFDAAEEVRFEYCDPWYIDIPGPTVTFQGMWEKKFSHLVAEQGDGTVWKMPLNHMATTIASPKSMKRDGLFFPAFDAGNNPAFEFVGETADHTSIGVCNWGYDIHFAGHYSREELYNELCPNFRIRLCPDDQAQQLLKEAQPVPKVEYNGFAELPLYERKTSFSLGIKLNEPSSGDTDPWPWLPQGEGAEWCKEEGRSDDYSLKISKQTEGPSEWVMDRESDGAWTERWTSGIAFRVTGYIKTENLQGRGTCLAVRWGVYNNPERFPYICSKRLTGTNDWTKVSVEIQGPPPSEISAIYLIFRQDGSGTSWLDDLEVEVLNRGVLQ
tara:strand:- start:221 stop:1636 length:1416 start_codon:yes stop_codon:yes gene_type:complete